MKISFEKRKRVANLKAIMERKAPKKPLLAAQIFADEKRRELVKESPDLKGPELQEKIDTMWKELSADDREEFDKKEESAKQNYEKAQEQFQNSPAVKAYQMALKGGSAGKVSAVPEPAKPDNYPKKPLNPMQYFMDAQKPLSAAEIFANEKRGDLVKESPDLKGPALQEKIDIMWKELSADDREEFEKKRGECKGSLRKGTGSVPEVASSEELSNGIERWR